MTHHRDAPRRIYDPSSAEKDFDYHLIRFRHKILNLNLRGKDLLELGSATGFSTYLLTLAADSVVSVDLDESSIARTSAFLLEMKSRDSVTLIQGDWREIESLASGPFSDIVWFGGAEYVSIEDAQGVLVRLKALLAKDGRVHLTVTNKRSMNRRLGLAMGLLKDIGEFSERDLAFGEKKWLADRAEIVALVEGSGYRTVHVEPFLLKPLPNSLMQGLTEDAIEGLFALGRDLPDWCSEIYVAAEKA